MNVTMANLAVQLMLYAAAWLAVGLIVQTHRRSIGLAFCDHHDVWPSRLAKSLSPV